MKRLSLVFAFAVACLLAPGHASAEKIYADTVRLQIVGGENWRCANGGDLLVQVYISTSDSIVGGSLGFSWASDSANWYLKDVTLSPVLAAWDYPGFTAKDGPLGYESLAAVLMGGVTISAPSLPAGTNQLWSEMRFALKPGAQWPSGSTIEIDSIFVPPAGYFLFVHQEPTGTAASYPEFEGAVSVTSTGACCCNPGDADADGSVNMGDPIYLIRYIFQNGEQPGCLDQCDANGDNSVDVSDVSFLVKYIFNDGVEPSCGQTGL
ncbi:MAG: hypothetical protein IIB00_04215 [candidate division Zixibacteria bacterium]|nr:hypothetical protein [candidate division Zixibacteria bacterium]